MADIAWIEWSKFHLMNIRDDDLIDVRTEDGVVYPRQPYSNHKGATAIVAFKRSAALKEKNNG
jgi:hypothetical protein